MQEKRPDPRGSLWGYPRPLAGGQGLQKKPTPALAAFGPHMPHKPVKFPQLSEEKSHEQFLNLPSLLFYRLMKGVQIVKKHKK